MRWKGLFFDVLYVILILVVIFFVYTTITILKSEAKQCLDNGFVYGASNQMQGEEVMCDCYEIKDGVYYPFHFNKTNWWSGDIQLKGGIVE
jgi:hypothetical protein